MQRGKNTKLGNNGIVMGLRNLLLEFGYPLYISETVEARNFKFGMRI